jgi:hypothetical protein
LEELSHLKPELPKEKIIGIPDEAAKTVPLLLFFANSNLYEAFCSKTVA